MHALVVVAHPDPKSLTHGVANALAEGVAGAGHATEIADLAAEGFDPSFSAADLAYFRLQSPAPADVAAEQARVDRADALVLVYPVYWWSFPSLLKGWIDRVFANGWAYEDKPGTKTVKKLRRLAVHLVAIGAADMRTYARHGYFGAMRTQIDHGIFDYCGARVVTSELLVPPDVDGPRAHFEAARAIGRNLFRPRDLCEATEAA
ncbi:Glutathione-regulated potassium-efflux system ancillary protein KefF [bacterium YEK0313]|nr:Glutathione-regulated potassium-efflux system ancillary protein KefF [bacterium YEK0313]